MTPTLFETVKKFFKEDDWPFTVNEQNWIRTQIKMENGSYVIWAQPLAEPETLIIYALSPDEVPEGLRIKMCEFITRANYGLRTATFEMDLADGELRCRAGLRANPSELTNDLVSRLVYAAAAAMDRYYPGIVAALVSSRSPIEIIRQIEGD